MTRFLSIAFVLLLAGCAMTPQLRTDTPANEAGYVVLSQGVSGKSWASYHLLKIRDAVSKETADIAYSGNEHPNNISPDFRTAIGDSDVFTLRLKPGEYEVYNFSSRQALGIGGDIFFVAKPDFSIPFRVEKGKVTYLGQFLAQQVHGRNVFGAKITKFFYYIVDDQADRDVAMAVQRRQVPATANVNRAVANATRVRHWQIRNEVMPAGDLPAETFY